MRKHQAKVSTTVFIIMLMLNTAQLQGIQDPEVPSPNQANNPWLLHDVIPRLTQQMSHDEFNEKSRDFAMEPLYLRLSATSDLLEILRSEEACVTTGGQKRCQEPISKVACPLILPCAKFVIFCKISHPCPEKP